MNDQLQHLEFAGENPCVVLYDDEGRVATAISYWNAGWSLHGTGHILFVLKRSPSGVLEAGVFSDNEGLARLAIGINQHFEGFQATNLNVPVKEAGFRFHRDADRVELICSNDGGEIRVTWGHLDAPRLGRSVLEDFGNQKGLSYEVSSVVIPAATGSIVIDGQPQPGRVIDGYGTLPKSAFLAICETWTRLGAAGQ